MASAARRIVKERIDTLLVARGLIESRQRAQAVLLAGEVRVDGHVITKPGALVPPSAAIDVLRRRAYVSRGGDKLAHALDVFSLDPAALTCLDAGASTGGFTDCLLQRGARKVYAIDVGYGSLDYGLRNDSRVVVMERTNVRDLSPLPEAAALAVIDVSFIGLEKVIPAIIRSLMSAGDIVALVKPQFQGHRDEVGRNGVVKEPLVHAAILGRFIAWAADERLRLLGLTASPLLGPAGNREFFVHLRPLGPAGPP